MGDVPEACRFMELSLKLLDKTADLHKTTCLLLTHTFIWHWKYPIRESLDKIILANELGMKSGNIEMVSLCPGTYCSFYFQCGLALKHVNSDMKKFVKDIREYTHNASLDAGFLHTVISWQAILNLMDKSNKDPFVLTGEAIDEEESIKIAKESGNGAGLGVIYGWKFRLSFILGDYEDVLRHMQQMDQYRNRSLDNSAFTGKDLFCKAITYFSAAQSEKRINKRYYLWQARSCHDKLKRWEKLGNPNFLHLLQMLKAEKLATRSGRYKEAIDEYKKGISFSLRLGFIQDAALAHERCAFLCQRQGNEFWRFYHLQEAHRLYARWNAFAKVQKMEELYPELKDGIEDGNNNGEAANGVHERSRHDPNIQQKRKKMELKRSSSPSAAFSVYSSSFDPSSLKSDETV